MFVMSNFYENFRLNPPYFGMGITLESYIFGIGKNYAQMMSSSWVMVRGRRGPKRTREKSELKGGTRNFKMCFGIRMVTFGGSVF